MTAGAAKRWRGLNTDPIPHQAVPPHSCNQTRQRQPNPEELADQDAHAPFAEKRQADRRHLNRLPAEEIAARVKRREKCNPQAAVSKAVENAMRGDNQEKIRS